MIRLVEPDIIYKDQYIKMIEKWRDSGQELEPWVLNEDYEDFEAMVKRFRSLKENKNVEVGFVPSTTFWLYDNESKSLVGAVNIRHYLNEIFEKVFGNVGYGVAPWKRGKGYATEALRLSIDVCKTMGMDKILVCCFEKNIPSIKVIEKNGGILENTIIHNGKMVRRYWIK